MNQPEDMDLDEVLQNDDITCGGIGCDGCPDCEDYEFPFDWTKEE